MKVFISQPMKGKTDEEILTERNAAIKACKERVSIEVEALDTFFKDAPHDAKPLWYLGQSILYVADADVVYFCKDWHNYNGCVIEHECAVRYGKKIIYA